jgi:hypothetical protein
MEHRREGKRREQEDLVGRWLSGASDGAEAGTREMLRYLRTWLKASVGNKCEKCGWGEPNPFDGVVPVQINHINGNPYDHRRENLEIICPNCHSLTENYGIKNKGNGRGNRHRSEGLTLR